VSAGEAINKKKQKKSLSFLVQHNNTTSSAQATAAVNRYRTLNINLVQTPLLITKNTQ
jgi:hypothetical protein